MGTNDELDAMHWLRCVTCVSILLWCRPGDAGDPQWGHLRGRFVIAGDPPRAESLPITKDRDVLGDTVTDESLVVNAENGGIANLVVYLLPGKDGLPVHPSYQETADSKLELLMKDGRFVPHMLLLRTSQTMAQRNRDQVDHHANVQFIHNTPR